MVSKSSPLISASCSYQISEKKIIKEMVNSVEFYLFELSCVCDIVCHKGSTWQGVGGLPQGA